MPYGYNKTSGSQWWKEKVDGWKANAALKNMLQTTNTVTQVNKGQITTYPFNVNTAAFTGSRYAAGGVDNKMTVSETHMQYDQLNMNPADIVVWYCLGGGSTTSLSTDLYLPETYDYMPVVSRYSPWSYFTFVGFVLTAMALMTGSLTVTVK